MTSNYKDAWKAMEGKQVRHAIYEYGIIDEIQENDDCLWIKFASKRICFSFEGFLNGQFGARLRWQEEFLEKQREEEIRKQSLEQEEKNSKQKEQEQKELAQKLQQQKEKEEREQLIKQISLKMEEDFLATDQYYFNHPSSRLVLHSEYIKIKLNFVQSWCKSRNFAVDDEQAEAIATTNGDIEVVARAGSGKTRTLVVRAIFLQQHCHVSPNELLLLAFNRKAVEEIQERIKTVTGKTPHVMTFHALAHAIVHPEAELIYDDDSAFQMKLSGEIQEVIDEHIRSPQHHSLIRDIMLMHFREDWEEIIKGNHHISLEERRKLPYESLNGDFVKSFGEKTIANILFEYGVAYKYERNYRWDGVNYRPDFTILLGETQGIVIEYFGLQGDRDYDEMSEQKREFWKSKQGWRLLEYSPSDIIQFGVESFERRLIDDLAELGIQTQKRTDEEIWDLIQYRAIDKFTKAIRSFVSRCRKLNLSHSELAERIKTHTTFSEAEKYFLNAALSIYSGYIQKLSDKDKEDFDGLMWKAVKKVDAGNCRFSRDRGREQGNIKILRFILIDEFQDFSEMFYRLCMAIRKHNSATHFFCVGDDWQAINEFAGSELRFFHNFSNYFTNTKQHYISSNYRSPSSIVQVGNMLMQGLGKPAIAKKQSQGDVLLCLLNELRPSAIEQFNHSGDEITPAILRLINYYLSIGREIVLLSRTNRPPWFVKYADSLGSSPDRLQKFREHIVSFFPKADHKSIQISSTHKYKGKEKAVVIVVDAVERSYPLIHPNWIFLRIFGESIQNIESAEKRLFYVALTRPEETLLIVTEQNQISPYIKDVNKLASIKRIDWNKYPPPPSLSSNNELVEVRVKEAFAVKEHLKRLGYKFISNGNDKFWSRTFPRQSFVFENFLQQNWINNIVEIRVYSEAQSLIHESCPKDR